MPTLLAGTSRRGAAAARLCRAPSIPPLGLDPTHGSSSNRRPRVPIRKRLTRPVASIRRGGSSTEDRPFGGKAAARLSKPDRDPGRSWTANFGRSGVRAPMEEIDTPLGNEFSIDASTRRLRGI